MENPQHSLKSALTAVQRVQGITGGDAIAFQQSTGLAVCGLVILQVGVDSNNLQCVVSTKTLNDSLIGDGTGVTATGVNTGLTSTSVKLSFATSTREIRIPSQDVGGHPLTNGGFSAKLKSIFPEDNSHETFTFPASSLLGAVDQVQVDLEGEIAQINYTQSLLLIIAGHEGEVPGTDYSTIRAIGQTPQRAICSQEHPLFPNMDNPACIDSIFSVTRKHLDALKALQEWVVQSGGELSITMDNVRNPTTFLVRGPGITVLVPVADSLATEKTLLLTAQMFENLLNNDDSVATILDYRFPVPPDLVASIQQAGKLTKLPLAFTITEMDQLVMNTVPSDPIQYTQTFDLDMERCDMAYPPFEVFAKVLGKNTYASYMCPYYNDEKGTVEFILIMSDDGQDLRNSVISLVSTVTRNTGIVGGGLASDSGNTATPDAAEGGVSPPVSSYADADEVPF